VYQYMHESRDGPWPDPSILLTRNPYFLTWPDEIFLTRREKNWKIWDFWGKFSKPKPNMSDQTQSEQQKLNRPRSKILDPDLSLHERIECGSFCFVFRLPFYCFLKIKDWVTSLARFWCNGGVQLKNYMEETSACANP